MTQRQIPPSNQQIENISKYGDKLKRGLYILNSIFLDDKTRWFSEFISRAYFQTDGEWQDYLRKIKPKKPIDFKTLRQNVIAGKYKTSDQIITDMVTVCDNSMSFSYKSNSTTQNVWYNEAKRLKEITLCLKKKKELTDYFYIGANDQHPEILLACPVCYNLIKPTYNHSKSKECGSCRKTIASNQLRYTCHNHNDGKHFLCNKCCIPYCLKCHTWHSKQKGCRTKYQKHVIINRNKSIGNGSSVHNHHQSSSFNVPRKPSSIAAVDSFNSIRLESSLTKAMLTMLSKLEEKDTQRHLFKPVSQKGQPDYYDIIKEPMDFGRIQKNITHGAKYHTIGDIMRHVNLVWANCFQYNGKPDLDHQTQYNGFANWAETLRMELNEYVAKFKKDLEKKGWFNTGNTGRRKSSSNSNTPPNTISSSYNKYYACAVITVIVGVLTVIYMN